jgi:hypothetical protein
MQNDINVKNPTDSITVALSPRQLDLLANVLEDMEDAMNEDIDEGLEPILAENIFGQTYRGVDFVEDLKVGVLGHIHSGEGSPFTFFRGHFAWYDEAMEERWKVLKGVVNTPSPHLDDEATTAMRNIASREMDEITTLASTMLTAMGVSNDGWPAWGD